MLIVCVLVPGAAVRASAADPVAYLDANGDCQNCSSYTTVTSDTTTWNSGWYVVNADKEITSRITVSGDVNLILVDSKTLTAKKGINVEGANSLTIYAQSTVEDRMGNLNATGAPYYIAGIGGGYFESGGTITINGGKVTAKGGSDSATAVGAGHGADTNKDNDTVITLGWTNDDDYIEAQGDYSGTVSFVNGKKFFLDGTTTVATKDNINKKKIVPADIPYSVEYLDANGATKTCSSYIPVTPTSTTWGSGWYVVYADTEITSRINVTGNVNLILMDGKTLSAKQGIEVSGGSLTIYAQSTDEDTMGVLTATGGDYAAGIGGSSGKAGGTITIIGGDVTATGGGLAAGIGGGKEGAGGNITISGGKVTATGGISGSGIGGGIGGAGGTI